MYFYWLEYVLASSDVKLYNIKEEARKMTFSDIISKIDGYSPAKNVVITGLFPFIWENEC